LEEAGVAPQLSLNLAAVVVVVQSLEDAVVAPQLSLNLAVVVVVVE
jgi:hypothetical protein